MNKKLVVDAMAFMEDEDYSLLSKSGKTLGEIIDKGFTDETRAFIKLMNRLYEIHADLEEELEEQKRENLKDFMKNEKFIIAPTYNNLSELGKKLADLKLTPIVDFNLPKIDFSNIVKRRD